MSRIFFLIEPIKDVRSALQFGDPVYLFSGTGVSPLNVEKFQQELDHELSKQNFNCLEDYFVMTGPSLGVALAYGLLLYRYSTVKILMFDALTSSYECRDVFPQPALES